MSSPTDPQTPNPRAVRMRWLDNSRRIARVDVRGEVSHFYEEELLQLRDQIDVLLKQETPWQTRHKGEST